MSRRLPTLNGKGITRRDFMLSSGASAAFLAINPLDLRGEVRKVDVPANLQREFTLPPLASRPWVYWWWLEGVATKEGITADLEEMKKKGISGVLLFDAGQQGGPLDRIGPKFLSEEWRGNFRYAVREAARLQMEMGVNLCSGWDAGGPWVEREDAIKIIVWRELRVKGPRIISEETLRKSTTLYSLTQTSLNSRPVAEMYKQDWYREIAVLVSPAEAGATWKRNTSLSLSPIQESGQLTWHVPPGEWTLLQFGYTLSDNQTKVGNQTNQTKRFTFEQEGWEIDPLSAHAMDEHFRNTALKLIEDAGQFAGTTFKYTHIDSWEIGQPGWTNNFVGEFITRRGYNPVTYLPALAGKTVDSAEITDRFKWDYRRTIADLVEDNYYGRLTQLSHQHGLGTHSEAGGPSYWQYINGLACLGADDIPMAEFWSSRPLALHTYEGVSDPFFRSTSLTSPACNTGSVRQAATAARIYGKAFCQAEAFTGLNRDWTEDPYFLKAYGDRAFCLGLGRIVIHDYALVPDFNRKPGDEREHISMHFNRNITWWDKSHAWLTYLARCQHMLRQGDFVADLLYFSGEAVPNFVLIDRKSIPGFDFDSVNAPALLKNASIRNKRIVFGKGTYYRYLIIPGSAGLEMAPAVLRKLRVMVHDGMTLIGLRPRGAPGLSHYPHADGEIHQIADELWGAEAAPSGERTVGQGRVVWGKSPDDVIKSDGLQPDLEVRGAPGEVEIGWIHRRLNATEIYFLANHTEQAVEVEVLFRVTGKTPELWDAVNGTVQKITEFHAEFQRTVVPMRFESKQSFFVVFSEGPQIHEHGGAVPSGFPKLRHHSILDGPWGIQFDSAWGGPRQVTFDRLQDWTTNTDEGIRYYSGEAVYSKTFNFSSPITGRCYLDLGAVKNVAQVYLNGKDLGVVWTAPWRVEITDVVKEGDNQLKIEVVNLWPNRLIKDATLPLDQRLTTTNVRTYDVVLPADAMTYGDPIDEERKKTGRPPELLSSGLLGPVTIKCEV